jgi:hypothetical protein
MCSSFCWRFSTIEQKNLNPVESNLLQTRFKKFSTGSFATERQHFFWKYCVFKSCDLCLQFFLINLAVFTCVSCLWCTFVHLNFSVSVMKTQFSLTVTNFYWFASLCGRTWSANSTTNMSLTVSWQERTPDSSVLWTFRLTLWEDQPVTCGELWCPGGLLPPTASWILNLHCTGVIVVGPTTGRHRQVPPADPPWSDITVRATTAMMCFPRNHPRTSKFAIDMM